MSAELLGHIGGQYGYELVNPSLYTGGDFGPPDFGKQYNENGVDGFRKAIASSERGPRVKFDVPLPGLGQTVLFGTATEAEGVLLGTIGQIALPPDADGNRKTQVIAIALAEGEKVISGRSVLSSIPVAIFTDVSTGVRERPIWTFHPENHRADVRQVPDMLRITSLFPPLSGGRSFAGSRL